MGSSNTKKERNNMELFLSRGLPVIAVIISTVSLYISIPSDEDIGVLVGDSIGIYHIPDEIASSIDVLQVLIPVVVNNSGGKQARVTRVSVVLQNTKSKDSYLLNWHQFMRYDNGWSPSSLAYQFAVGPSESVFHNIKFEGGLDSSDWNKYEGNYILRVLVFSSLNDTPSVVVDKIVDISESTSKSIGKNRRGKRGNAEYLKLTDEKWSARKLNEGDVKTIMTY